MERILAHGTFDIIHYGHLNYLEKAKSYGDYLIVLVSSDKVVKKKKGKKEATEKINVKTIKGKLNIRFIVFLSEII